MRIEKLEIKGFGKIENLNLNFTPGLNIVFGRNESGKTSIQWFIKAMFFGLRGGRASKEGVLPSLKKFKPWKTNDFNGCMEYRLGNGEFFRVERNFNSNSSRVLDSLYNDITPAFDITREKGVAFAEKHLGLNEACFDKTVFIQQMESKIGDDGSRELLNRLMNVSETGFEDVSYKKAQEALKEALKSYVGTEKTTTRPLDKINIRLEELKSSGADLKRKRDRQFSLEEELNNARTEKSDLENKKSVLSKLKEGIYLKIKLENSKKLKHSLEENEKLKLEISRNRIKVGNNCDISTLAGKKKRFEALFFGFAFLSAIFGIAGLFRVQYAIPAALVAFAFFVIFLFLRAEQSNKIRDINNNRSEIVRVEDDRCLKSDSRGNDSTISEIKKLDEEIRDIEGRWKEYVHEINKLTNKRELILGYSPYFDQINMGRTLEETSIRLEAENNYVDEALNKALLKIKEYETLLKNSVTEDEELQRIEEETEYLECKKTKLEEINSSLRIALDTLTEASMEIQRDFTPALNIKMSEIIHKISGGRYRDLRADDKLTLKTIAPETGEVVQAGALSGGTIDQMYLALRIAMSEILTLDKEGLPLFMDEVFAQYDDTRTEETFNMLSHIIPRRQVILFTCKVREVEIAREIFRKELNVIEM